MKKLKFLKIEDFKNLRVIRCSGKEYNLYEMFLFYFRDKEFVELDVLDNTILDALNQNQDAHFEYNKLIMFENESDDIIKKFKLKEEKNITIQLSPIGNDELIDRFHKGEEIYSYIKKFKIQFAQGHEFIYFADNFISHMDNNELKRLIGTVKPI